VTDRWKRFSRRIDEDFESLKSRLTITIYGSYQPPEELEFLRGQKQFLIDNGYTQTKIVLDYESEGLTPLEISKLCLKNSEVNFLFFTREGKRLGVVRELAYVADDPEMAQKTSDCVVFDEIKDENGSVPPLSMDDIKNSGIIRHEYSKEDSLQEALLSKAFWYVRQKRSILEERPDS